MSLYNIAQPAGAMVSSAMQGGLSTNLEGVLGRAEIALARARRVNRKPQIGITPKTFLRCFTFWQLWAIAIAWPIGGNFAPVQFYNLWLKSLTNPDGTKK
ncbi:hypothetical protein QQZ08_008304 [Neonectria magnoliae]|uniref:Uncharacterized protein n=1 Tax=Neonectria magnoliae TaxID=2732573 RepID=A0ABR1HWG7_9HYPO